MRVYATRILVVLASFGAAAAFAAQKLDHVWP
jgi:hypothetical protein